MVSNSNNESFRQNNGLPPNNVFETGVRAVELPYIVLKCILVSFCI